MCKCVDVFDLKMKKVVIESERKLQVIKRACSMVVVFVLKRVDDRSRSVVRANNKKLMKERVVGCRKKEEKGRKRRGYAGGKRDPYTKW